MANTPNMEKPLIMEILHTIHYQGLKMVLVF